MKIWIILFIGVWSTFVFGQTRESFELECEISDLSRIEEYEQAIEKLQGLVLDSNTSSVIKAEAYFLKHKIYSKIGIYTEAESNLAWFVQQGLKTGQTPDLYEGRYKLAVAMLACKKLEYQEAIAKIEEIRDYSTGYTPTEFAAYLFLEGVQKMEQEKAYDEALIFFEASIKLFKQDISDYLPTVYKELLRLHIILNNHTKVKETYMDGLRYGEAIKVIPEVLQLHRFMADYYQAIGKNSESLALSDLVLRVGTAYNMPHRSSKLFFVEKKVLEQSKIKGQLKTKTIQYLLIFSVFVVCVLIGFYFNAYKKNRNKRELVEQENQTLKMNYTNLKEEKKKEVESVLTERQAHILKLVKQGKTNKEIAVVLCISENTVKYHLKIMYDVLKINGRSDLL